MDSSVIRSRQRAGFALRYANTLFGVFQRLHLLEELARTSLGLTTLQRIIRRHGGKLQGRVDQARRRQADLLDLAHDAIFVCDMNKVVTYWSRGAEALYGWTAEEASGKPAADLLKTVFPAPLERIMADMVRTGRWEGELLRARKNGTEVVVASRWSLQRDARGAPIAVLETNNDVTERKRAEILLAGEKRILGMLARGDPLEQILESLCLLVEAHAPDVLASILLIEDGRLKHGGAPSLPADYIKAVDGLAIGPRVGSCGAAAYFGKQIIVSDILNDPLWVDYREVMLPLSLRACWSTPIRSFEGKVIGTFAMYYHKPRSPSRGDQEIIEQITHLAGVAIQQKLIEQKLLRSEAYLREAQRLSHTGSWARSWAMSPRPGEVIYCSEEMLRLWGFDPLDGLPSSEQFEQRIHLEDRALAHERFWQAVRRKADYVNDFRILLPDGTVKFIQAIGHPMLDASGEVLEYVGTAVDVTERKRAEEGRDRLHQLEADLAHVHRVTTMGELTASLGHELNQPIAAAITNAYACLQWLKRDQPDLAEAREAATRMINDAKRAAGIIDRLLSFHRKGTPPRREPVDVNEVAAEMLMLLHSEATRYAIDTRTDLTPALPTIMADRVQLQQVFMNLMINGIEAMKERPGELIVKSELFDDGQLLISVSDTGIGLPAGKNDQIFKTFFTTKPQGTGMGLSISRRIVESHGGRLWASANTGRGATFCFTLPSSSASSAFSAT